MTLLPIGSVLKINEVNAIICGYQIQKKEEHNTLCYVIVPYPTGFGTMRDVYTIPTDADMEVVFQGYRSKGYHIFAKPKEQINELMKQYTAEEWDAMLDKALEELNKLQEEK